MPTKWSRDVQQVKTDAFVKRLLILLRDDSYPGIVQMDNLYHRVLGAKKKYLLSATCI